MPKLTHYVKTYRKKCALSQRDVAAMLGYTKTNLLSQLECGEQIHHTELAVHLAIALNVPLEELLAPMFEEARQSIGANTHNWLEALQAKQLSPTPMRCRRMQTLTMLVNNLNNDDETSTNKNTNGVSH